MMFGSLNQPDTKGVTQVDRVDLGPFGQDSQEDGV
jgi:hypothetical protein